MDATAADRLIRLGDRWWETVHGRDGSWRRETSDVTVFRLYGEGELTAASPEAVEGELTGASLEAAFLRALGDVRCCRFAARARGPHPSKDGIEARYLNDLARSRWTLDARHFVEFHTAWQATGARRLGLQPLPASYYGIGAVTCHQLCSRLAQSTPSSLEHHVVVMLPGANREDDTR